MDSIEIKNRLKTLNTDPLLKVSLDEKIAEYWPKTVKRHLAYEILKILKSVYEPLGLWLQNPSEKINEDYGVVIDGFWSALMQLDTNWTCHSMMFNRCNLFLVNLFRKKNIEQITIEGEIFSYKNPIIFKENESVSETIIKINSILKILKYKKNEIFLIGSPFCEELIKMCNITMGIGDKAQKYYEDRISDFFDDIIEYKSTKGRGDYNDRKTGVDIWVKHNNYDSKQQVKSLCSLYLDGENYFIDTSISYNSICDYYVFVCLNKRITIFKNDKKLITPTLNGFLFSKKLLYKDKEYYEQ